ncbi:2-octaprenylphenol hydroxylase [Alteribacillus persepolensis]|uniref:2-octaprenylphenol hydroxylase n=1 Tax=Alteribacillus persepolensis TaxID=568899 RepID=A0A1G7ZBY5_9BACI|nr:AarF/ABC1/UbiB kinase family protein [Alteribacillus persepolensis]SDH06135.1 2-octaprenylphenol hydroxylase [Alteribacillus persepolensis]
MALTRGLKHANRYRKIASTLARHGFGYILQEVGLFHVLSLPKRLSADSGEVNMHSIGKRIRLVIEELGPTFIKLGQLISTRKDIFPPSVIEELEKLQDNVPPFPFEKGKQIIENDLGASLDDLFSSFSKEPLAAASIGQVHKATLHNGKNVAVKISRPHIKEIIEKDIDILRDLAKLLTQRFQWARYYRLQDVIEEYVDAIRDEVDYYVEARNTEKMKNNMAVFSEIDIPNVLDDYSSRRVLTMSFAKGVKLSELNDATHHVDKKAVARTLTDAFLHQVLVDGFFHSDPHPGNIIFTGEKTAAFIDFGQIGRLNKAMRQQFINYVIAMTKKHPDLVADAIYDMADIPGDIDDDHFAEDVEYLLQKYYDRPFHEIKIGEAINDIFATAHRYEIQIYKEYTLLAKAIITLESVVERLDPNLSIVKVAEPYGHMLAKERLNPKTNIYHWLKEGRRQKDYLLDIPKELRDTLEKISKDRVGIEMNIPKINIFLNKLDRISNRLSFSIILLAFSIIMVGLIIGSTFGDSSSPLVQLPVIEISFIATFIMFLWLLYAIFKSGRF